jgi:hypothetical protein
MSFIDAVRGWFKRGQGAMRDRYNDREAGTDPKFGVATPSGDIGPSGRAIDEAQSAGGAIEPDEPKATAST